MRADGSIDGERLLPVTPVGPSRTHSDPFGAINRDSLSPHHHPILTIYQFNLPELVYYSIE